VNEQGRIALRAYYAAFLAAVFLDLFDRIRSLHQTGWHWLWPVTWLAFFDRPDLVISAAFYLLVAALVAAISFPYHRLLKIVIFLNLFFLLAAVYSRGKIDHNLYGFLFTSFFMAWIQKPVSPELWAKNIFFYRTAQLNFLFLYFLAGFWKLRVLVTSLLQGYELKSLAETLGYEIAVKAMEGQAPTPLGLSLMNSPLLLQGLLWLLIVCIELFGVCLICRPRLLPWYGVSLILFHIGTQLTMSIAFPEAQLLAAVLLIGWPLKDSVVRLES
jgi:hypothetical protein